MKTSMDLAKVGQRGLTITLAELELWAGRELDEHDLAQLRERITERRQLPALVETLADEIGENRCDHVGATGRCVKKCTVMIVRSIGFPDDAFCDEHAPRG